MPNPPTFDPSSPWHDGEREIRRRAGVEADLEAVGPRVIVHAMPRQHGLYFAKLPYVVLGTIDRNDDAWATLMAGIPGFLAPLDAGHLRIGGSLDAGDPAAAGWIAGAPVAALGIDLRARRRARLNGVLERVAADHAVFAVRQAFGNCPQYIHSRGATFARDPDLPWNGNVASTAGLSDTARALIGAADTFFVASYTDRQDGNVRSADVSHRGGRPGFVRVRADELTIPDFRGNNYFNTLGNFAHTPRAGLTFVNFENGDLLQVTGDVTLEFDGTELAGFAGAERLWRVRVRRSVFRAGALALRFAGGEPSPQSLATGNW